MNHNRFPQRRYLLAGIVVISIVLVTLAAIQVNAQDQSVTDLVTRLKQWGVPVKDITLLSRVPFRIGIVLQSSSNSQSLAPDDPWFMQLTRREATLAYRIGMKVNSYSLTVLNTKGETISSGQAYIYPGDPSQQLISTAVSKLNNAATRRIIMDRLQFGGMSLDKLDVISDTIPSDNGQILLIQLSAPDLSTANGSLTTFLGSLFKTLSTINDEQGTRLVLCRVRLVDHTGNVLLSYVKDIETGQEQWSAVKGLTNEWYPHPQETPSNNSPIPTPIYPPSPISTPHASP